MTKIQLCEELLGRVSYGSQLKKIAMRLRRINARSGGRRDRQRDVGREGAVLRGALAFHLICWKSRKIA